MDIVGTVQIRSLDLVKPNGWNPNRMTPRLRESLKHGFENDGWIISQALLIWGTDETGKDQGLIIDGEHRWTIARELGFGEGPMVQLDGLTEAEAKALTIKMNQKRGEFDEVALAELVKELQVDLDVDDLALDLGLEDKQIAELLSITEPTIAADSQPDPTSPKVGTTAGVTSENTHVKMVPIYMKTGDYDEFVEDISMLSKRFDAENVSDTILAAIAWLRINHSQP